MSPVKIVYELVHFSKIRKQNIEFPIMLKISFAIIAAKSWCQLFSKFCNQLSSIFHNLNSIPQSYDFIFISARDFGEKFWNSRFCLVKICDVYELKVGGRREW